METKQLNIDLLNKILSNLECLDNNKELEFVDRIEIDMAVTKSSYGNGDGVQGAEDIYAKVYKIKSEDNLFLKIEYFTDSYGYNESVRSVKLVIPSTKTIQVFE